MASDKVQQINDLNFDDEVIHSATPVLVDFTATWCGPCKQLAPIIDQLADEYADKLKVVKVDIEESPETARRFSVRGVPTLYVFKGGELVGQHVGLAPKRTITNLVDGAL